MTDDFRMHRFVFAAGGQVILQVVRSSASQYSCLKKNPSLDPTASTWVVGGIDTDTTLPGITSTVYFTVCGARTLKFSSENQKGTSTPLIVGRQIGSEGGVGPNEAEPLG